VDDAERVTLCQGVAGLDDEVDCLRLGESATMVKPRREITAFEKLTRNVRRPWRPNAHVGNAEHVLALELALGSRLPSEPRYFFGAAEPFRTEDLEEDLHIELKIAGTEDDAPASIAEDAFDAVSVRGHATLARTPQVELQWPRTTWRFQVHSNWRSPVSSRARGTSGSPWMGPGYSPAVR
jgi:hypothetical protein